MLPQTTLYHSFYLRLEKSEKGQRQKLIDEGMGDFLDQVEFYTRDDVFYLTEDSSWNYILQHAKQDDIALKIDTALHT